MPSAQHFMYAKETTWGTYVAPTVACPVRTVSIKAAQPLLQNTDTGGGRGERPGVSGALSVSGDLTGKLYPRGLGLLLRGMYRTRAKTSSVSSSTVNVSTWTIGTFTPPGSGGTKVTTSGAHGMAVGDWITVAGATGGTPTPNGERQVINVESSTVFYINLTTSSTAPTGGTVAKTSIRNKLLMDDSQAFDSYSLQKRFGSSVAESVVGAKMGGYKITAKAKEFVEFVANFTAKDSATKGTVSSFFADGTTAAPNVADPTNLYPWGVNDPVAFVGGSITLGGSVALTSGELVYTGGTMRHSFDNITLEVKQDLAADDYEVYLDSRLLGSLFEGKRSIMLGWDPNFEIVDNEFFHAWKFAQTAVVKLAFQGRLHGATGVREGFEFVFPNVRYEDAPNPDVSGDIQLQRVPVKARAQFDSATNTDHGLVITCGEDLTV